MQGSFDLKNNQLGISGNGTFQKNISQNPSGNSSTSAGSVTKQGYPGWSRSMNNDEFDLPEEIE